MFAENVIKFLTELEFSGSLPAGISIMNPYRENPAIIPLVTQFYRKYYDDQDKRHLILGINPGRFGAGVTGIPFTDTKRLSEKCGLTFPDLRTFETSSVFIYEMIEAFGGVEMFYSKFFIGAVSPLGLVYTTNGKSINYNYYDSPILIRDLKNFIIENLRRQIDLGTCNNICFCLGTGKNFKFLERLNSEYHFFVKIIPLEHPRFIMQYKTKKKDVYINKYLEEFSKI